MRILVFGSSGFVGTSVARALSEGNEVRGAVRRPNTHTDIPVDLLDPPTIKQALSDFKPEAIVQCAGVIDNDQSAAMNPKITGNLLEQVTALRIKPKIIICGSAAEYGVVSKENIPVKEDTPLNAASPYALSKVEETRLALKARMEFQLPLVVARLFNPIGKGMNSRFFIPNILAQINDFQAGKRRNIEINRLDSRRDYIDIHDLAAAVKVLIEGSPEHDTYNIGSGRSTSNAELLDLLLKSLGIESAPPIVETLKQPGPLVAVQADISRIHKELGWTPAIPLKETVQEIVSDT